MADGTIVAGRATGAGAGDGGSAAAAEWRGNWKVVVAATAGMSLASMSSYSIGVMMAPVEQDLGWSRAEIASGLSIVAFFGVAFSTVMGLAIDRVGARRIGILAASLLCGAMMLMSMTTTSIWSWWALWALVGICTSAMPTVWTASISGLFSAGRGLAIAITLSGTGISASLVPFIANYFVEHHGWRTAYLALGGFWALLTLPLIILFFRGASDRKSGGVKQGKAAAAATLPGLTAREGFASITFYKIALIAVCFSIAGVSIVINFVPILNDAGFSRGDAAAIAGIIGFATVSGKLVGGWLLDRMHAGRVAASAALASTILPIVLLTLPGSVIATAAAVAVFSFASGANFGAIVFLAGRYFGQRSFGVMFGTVHALMALGTGLAPVLSNRVYDVMRSYDPVLMAAIPVLVVASLLLASLGPYPDFTTEDARQH